MAGSALPGDLMVSWALTLDRSSSLSFLPSPPHTTTNLHSLTSLTSTATTKSLTQLNTRIRLHQIYHCIMKGSLALSLLPLLASASPVLVDSIHNEAAPILSSTQSQDIPDSYIVVFKDGLSHSSASAHHEWVQDQHLQVETSKRDLLKRSQMPFTTFGGLKHTYNVAGGLLGYSGHFDESVIEQVRRHPDVSKTPDPSLISLSTRT